MLARITAKNAAITGLVMGLWLILEYYLGFRTTNFAVHLYTNFLNPAFVLIGLVITFLQVAKGQTLKFLDGLKITVIFALICGLIYSLSYLFYYQVIDPGYIERIRSFFHYITALENPNWYEVEEQFNKNAWQYGLPFRTAIPFIMVTIVSTLVGLPLSLYYQLRGKKQ